MLAERGGREFPRNARGIADAQIAGEDAGQLKNEWNG